MTTPMPGPSRAKTRGARSGYAYLHSAIVGHTRLAYTESLENAHGPTAVAFLNRACYRSNAFAAALNGSEPRRTKPYTPKQNGKVERYNRILTEEFLYARTLISEHQREKALET